MAYSAIAVAQYIIDYCTKNGLSISNLKLQKLLYFAQIEFYKATKTKLYSDEIYAWQLGPVVPEVYSQYCMFGGKSINRQYTVSLKENDQKILDDFLFRYGGYSASRLVDMSHEPGGAWDETFDGGKGNRSVIPFDLITLLECD